MARGASSREELEALVDWVTETVAARRGKVASLANRQADADLTDKE